MDHHPPPTSADEPGAYSVTVRGIALASVALGYFSMLVFWWKPFGMCLAAVGFVLGAVSLAVGNKGGRWGENYALGGVILCGFTLAITNGLYWGVQYLSWGYAPWPKVWGF